MMLLIDTADLAYVFIGLADGEKLLVKKKFKAQYQQTERLLPAIEKLLKSKGRRIQKLTSVAVVVGPGPFTATRIGVVTANALSWALGIPVVGVRKNEFTSEKDLMLCAAKKVSLTRPGGLVEVLYDKEPNITLRT